MGGFLNNSLNTTFQYGVFSIIIDRLLFCSKTMKKTCLEKVYKIPNDEETIRTHLLEKYLNNDILLRNTGLTYINLRFIPEAQENYSSVDDSYAGRTDIKVVTESWFKNINDYYTIECKRIDGNLDLNKKYVTKGISRFVIEPVQYNSYHNCNIMFGFVVRNIKIDLNTDKIADIQLEQDIINSMIVKNFSLVKNDADYYLYFSLYNLKNKQIELQHIFYDFSQIIK